jgi:hypothetical protein
MNKINYFLNHIKRIVIYKLSTTMNNFDTQPLLSEINTIVNNGFQEILKDYMKRHWLLEQTHDTLVNLPTVKEHYANKTECVVDPYKDVKVKLEPGVDYVTKEETLKLIQNLDNKLNDFVKVNNELFNKLLIQVNELKLELSKVSVSTTDSTRIEKENIKLEIVDDVVNESKIDENENVDQEVEVVEVESKIEELVIDVVEDVEEVEELDEDIISVETEMKDPEEEDDDDEEELIEIEIDDITYCTNNEENGIIYELDKEGNVGKRVGCLKEGDAYFD